MLTFIGCLLPWVFIIPILWYTNVEACCETSSPPSCLIKIVCGKPSISSSQPGYLLCHSLLPFPGMMRPGPPPAMVSFLPRSMTHARASMMVCRPRVCVCVCVLHACTCTCIGMFHLHVLETHSSLFSPADIVS